MLKMSNDFWKISLVVITIGAERGRAARTLRPPTSEPNTPVGTPFSGAVPFFTARTGAALLVFAARCVDV